MEKELFDFGLLITNQQRYLKQFPDYNFLYHQTADLIIENLLLHRQNFNQMLEINSRDGYLSNSLLKLKKTTKVVKTNFVQSFFDLDSNSDPTIKRLVIDDSFTEFSKQKLTGQKFDLIVSNLDFHYLNDISSWLITVKSLLEKDGIFIASFFGQDNLLDLKKIFLAVESEIYGSVSPRFAPTIEVKTAAHLLQKSGFGNPISDLEKITVSYQNPLDLLRDLKLMGQANIMKSRSKKFFTRKFLQEVIKRYKQQSYDPKISQINANFEIITIIGQNI